MLYTCGLDSVGGREGYELHGTLHNTPARITRAECDENGIVVEAIIRDTALFGKNLVLKRRIFSAIGGDCVSLEDTLINESFRDEDYCILYHINVGYPMLDEGSRIVADIASCEPRTAWAEEQIDTAFEIGHPIPNREETCYFLTLNKPEISLVNENLGKTFTVSYSGDTLPCFLEWKSLASGDYALGLEPCTTKLDHHFTYKTIQPNQKIDFKVQITINETDT